MTNFADCIFRASQRNNTHLVAGFDPVLDNIPKFLYSSVERIAKSDEEFIFKSLTSFHSIALDSIKDKVSSIKPNLAFFEQYGTGGLRAYEYLCKISKDLNLPIIADAKRGDIGSTAEAYANAFLGSVSIRGEKRSFFSADALTVNPYLGFDTLEPFLNACVDNGKGLFVLVRTSNAGSSAIQRAEIEGTNKTVSEIVSDWINLNSSKLLGAQGVSGLGAVIGGTTGEDIKYFRSKLPDALFLIPGMGTQGGSADDVSKGFKKIGNHWGGAVVNASRGLLGSFDASIQDEASLRTEIGRRADKLNEEISRALRAQ